MGDDQHVAVAGSTGAGEHGVRICIGGVAVKPGDWIYADADGILVAQQKLS
jgi:regulator of ribonuclease activity A